MSVRLNSVEDFEELVRFANVDRRNIDGQQGNCYQTPTNYCQGPRHKNLQ